MSQAFREILGTDLLSDSREYLNDNFDAIRSRFVGATEPSVKQAYDIWLDTTSGYEKERNAANDAWIVVGLIGSAYRGVLPLSGGTMAGAIAMGGYGITGLPLGTGTAAARQQEVDLKATIAAPALTGDATVNQDPAGNNSLTRRSWTEARYLKLTGGTMTGAIVLSGVATADLHPAGFKQVKDLVTFNTTTGHRHDGSDARKVRYADLDGVTTFSRLVLPDNQQLMVSRTSSIAWTTLDISSYGVPAAAHAAMVKLVGTGVSSNGIIELRKTGTAPSDPQAWTSCIGESSLVTFVDCVGQQFDYKMTTSGATLKIYLLGYMTTVGA
jgi:hypothetical protein